MDIVDRKLNEFIRPDGPNERNYAIFGRKLVNQDAEFFNNFKEEYIHKLKTAIKAFFSSIVLSIFSFLIAIFNRSIGLEEYWTILVIFVLISYLLLFFIYVIYFIPFTWVGIYSRSWIKLLEQKNMISKVPFSYKFTGKYSVILFPAIQSYLETINIPTFITEDDIRSVAPLSKDFDKIKREHVKFDNSILRFNE